ncbi:MAG: hypothetical protein Tsb0019_31170 [Roseibium sp.]
MTLRAELLVVDRYDAGGFLAAVLKGVQAERRQRAGVLMAHNAEDTAFFAQGVGVDIERLVCLGPASHGEHSFVLAGWEAGLGHRVKPAPFSIYAH